MNMRQSRRLKACSCSVSHGQASRTTRHGSPTTGTTAASDLAVPATVTAAIR